MFFPDLYFSCTLKRKRHRKNTRACVFPVFKIEKCTRCQLRDLVECFIAVFFGEKATTRIFDFFGLCFWRVIFWKRHKAILEGVFFVCYFSDKKQPFLKSAEAVFLACYFLENVQGNLRGCVFPVFFSDKKQPF